MELKIIVISSVTIFVILLVLYRVYQDEIFTEPIERCNIDETCVRFCCANETACENDSHFDVSDWAHALELKKDFRVIRGKPCKEGYTGDAPWSFLAVKKKLCKYKDWRHAFN